MKRHQKIGQLMMAGFEGLAPSDEIRHLIQAYDLGGVILFSRNIQDPLQCAALTQSLQELSDKPLLIAIDQEGGRVSRLPPPFTPFPSARQWAKKGSLRWTYSLARAMALELGVVGINMNMAPVLDVDTCPDNPIIGDRSFGADPKQVADHAIPMMLGLMDNRIIPCGKHFPGHGDTTSDSHFTLPRISHSMERLSEIELRPFMDAIAARIPALMTAHIQYDALDRRWPASLSSKIITDLLRKKLKYHAAILTDDLEMKGITGQWTVPQAAVQAIRAGSDMVLVCRSYPEQIAALEAIIHAVERGNISEVQVTQSVARLSRLKKRYGIPHPPNGAKMIEKIVGCVSHRLLVKKISH